MLRSEVSEHDESVRIRKELLDAKKATANLLDLCEDEIRQNKATSRRKEELQEKIPHGLEDQIETVQETHKMQLEEHKKQIEQEHHLHLRKEQEAEARRQAAINERIAKAEYLETHKKD